MLKNKIRDLGRQNKALRDTVTSLNDDIRHMDNHKLETIEKETEEIEPLHLCV